VVPRQARPYMEVLFLFIGGIMKDLIYYILIFLVVYLFYVVFVICRKNVLKNFPNGKEMKYLKMKYGIKINDSNLKRIANTVFLGNAFILSTTVFVVCLFDKLYLEIIVGLITLLALMFIIYHLIGTYYKKKQGGK
jgi:hypothetical protein